MDISRSFLLLDNKDFLKYVDRFKTYVLMAKKTKPSSGTVWKAVEFCITHFEERCKLVGGQEDAVEMIKRKKEGTPEGLYL